MMVCRHPIINKWSWIYRILYQHCQFNKVARMPTSTTYFSRTKETLLRDDTQWIHARKSQHKSTGQTEAHAPWICLPQGDLPTVHFRYTHRSSALPGGPLVDLPSLSLTTNGSWNHLWVGSPSLSSALWRQYSQHGGASSR